MGIRPSQFHDHGGVGIGEAAGEFADGQRAGQYRQHLVAGRQRNTDRRRGRADRRHTRHDHRVETVGQSSVHVHIGAIEQGVTLSEQRNITAGVQMRGDPIGGLGVEVLHRAVVTAGVVGIPGRDRVDQVFLDLTFA